MKNLIPIEMWMVVDENGIGDIDTLSAVKADCRPKPRGSRIAHVKIVEIGYDNPPLSPLAGFE